MTPVATPSAGYTPRPIASEPGLIIIQPGASRRGNDAYAPGPVEVPQGATVSFFNNDTETHTATANDGSWDSGDIAPGETARFSTKDTANGGDIPFHCRHHPTMKGVLRLTPNGNGAGATPSSSATASLNETPPTPATPSAGASRAPESSPSPLPDGLSSI